MQGRGERQVVCVRGVRVPEQNLESDMEEP